MSTEDKLKGCVIRLTHIPYGFFDKELLGYFSQFGRVVRARVPKSKTGRFLNKAYVAFDDPTVARLAAETMENYLMFDKRVRCKVLNGVPKVLRSGPVIAPGFSIDKKKVEYAKKASDYKSEEDINAGLRSSLAHIRKTLRKLKEKGYDYEYDFSHKIPEAIKRQSKAE